MSVDGAVTPEEIRARAAAAGISIPEDRMPAFIDAVARLRAALTPLRADLARRPVGSVFGGADDGR
jgi:hypothetical protein